ncbi:hypothetical protein JCM19233_2723 [Vibrio astriarenae]|nr:hypothetical protein JCM19233_2723 [Vibrio sp. C7]
MMNATTLSFPQQMSRVDRSARQWLMGKLETLPVGRLTIVERYFEQEQVTTLGNGALQATVIVNDGRFSRACSKEAVSLRERRIWTAGGTALT